MTEALVRRTFELAMFESREEQAAIECCAVIWDNALGMLADLEGRGKRVWMAGEFGET